VVDRKQLPGRLMDPDSKEITKIIIYWVGTIILLVAALLYTTYIPTPTL
jgi:hypothetical protein